MAFRAAFTIQSDTRYLSFLRDFVSALSHMDGGHISKRSVIEVSLALVEAVDNAIFHAHGHKRDMPIEIAFDVGAKRVVIDVLDSGGGIGKFRAPSPDAMSDHGRGLFLINKIMKRVSSCKIGSRHRLRMEYDL